MKFLKKYENFLECDWSKIPNLFLLILVFILARIPLLNLGFGLDPDAWRIANAAFDLRYAHSYHTSRFPGYPLPEFINALVINYHWLATNSLTMFLSLISVILYAQILKHLKIINRGLLTLTYAFIPILWINSTNTMDYMWSLAFIIITWFLILHKKPPIAGSMLALAIGARPQSAIFIIPFLYLIWHNRRSIRNIMSFLMTTILISTFLFIPLFLTYGLNFIRHYPAEMNFFKIVYQMIKFFGLPALLLGIVILVFSLRDIYRMVSNNNKDNIFNLLCIILVTISFIAMPYHIEYIIPAIPFGILLFGKMSRKIIPVILCIFLLAHAFVSLVSIEHLGENRISIKALGEGAIIKNMRARAHQLNFTRRLMAATIENHAVVIIGPWLPIFSYLDENVSSIKGIKRMFDSNSPQAGVWNFQKDIWYRYLLTPDELKDLRNKGYKIYYIKGLKEYTKEIHGYDLDDYQCTYLKI